MKRNLLLIAFVHFFLALQASPLTRGTDRLPLLMPPGPDAFVTTWETTSDQESIVIPVSDDPRNLTYNYSVDWGDGSVSDGQTTNATHIYATAGKHTVSITGVFPAIQFSNAGSNDDNDFKLKSVDQWGTQVWQGMDAAFQGCRNLTTVANSPGPIFAPNSTLYNMFSNCRSLNCDLDNWDLSKIRETSFMFFSADKFNGNISNWNVANVTNMQNMFESAESFNGNIENWTVDKVALMDNMFSHATSFNGNIGNWNVSNVTTMASMFYLATSFDQNLGNWQVSSVSSMDMMLVGSGLSAVNYETTLAGWATQNVHDGLKLYAAGLKYCATDGRQSLIDNHAWVFIGDKPACLIPAFPDEEGIVYVDSSNATPGDGSSWNNALNYLSNALVSAESNTDIKEIHLARGTYFPTGEQNSQDRDSSFTVRRAGLRILGGYASGGGARDVQANRAIVSGDIGVLEDSTDNNYHVMTVANIPAGTDSMIIDGITFKLGNANNSVIPGLGDIFIANSQGGGLALYAVADNVVVRNCTFTRNYGVSGGGMLVMGEVIYDGNSSQTYKPSTPLISNCLFLRNGTNADQTGGGAPFGNFGGAMYNVAASPVVRQCTFTENSGFIGGAIGNQSFASPIFVSSTFTGNKAVVVSVLFNIQASNSLMANCLITNNINTGDITGLPGDFLSTFGNAVIANFQLGSTRLINSTISGNYSTDPNNLGAGILNAYESKLYVTNSVIWGNQSSVILDSLESSSYISNSLVQGLGADAAKHILDGTVDFDIFADTSHGNYRLNVASPGINAGLNDSITSALLSSGGVDLYSDIDLDGHPRIYGGTVDLGAYEVQRKKVQPDAQGILYVKSSAAWDGDGSSWATALPSFDSALYVGHVINHNATAVASDELVDQIWVANGTYLPAQDSAFAMLPKVKIYGSFAGTESDPSDRDYSKGYTSVLKGNGNSVIRNNNNGLDASSVLDGFTITGGSANGSDEFRNGGGIYNRSVSPTLSNLVINNNSAAFAGGGIANREASPIIVNVTLKDNTAASEGGGIYVRDATGIELYNTLIFGNTAKYGGGMFNGGGAAKLTNLTITGNTASIHGGGMSNGNATVEMNNSILWNNNGNNIGNELYNEQSDAVLNFSLYNKGTENIYVDIGSHFSAPDGITADPSFMDASTQNYALKEGSPAINEGDNTILPLWDLTDVTGQDRVVDAVVDLGAIEFTGLSLPVKMSPLKGQLENDGHVVLNWSTFTEVQNKGFQVQESSDGVQFVNSHFIPSLGHGGNSSSTLQYKFDAGILSGIKYYRLQQTDLNGNTTHSNIVRLQANKAAFHLTAYPNPARNFITVHVEGTMGLHSKVMVIDLPGRVLKTQKLSGNDSKVDLSALASGIYLIKYVDDKQNAVIRIIKQ